MSDDLIRRQDAIDALARIAREKFNLSNEYNQYLAGLLDGENAIWRLPSAQPERKKGEWIPMPVSSGRDSWKCSVCGRRARGKKENLPFCHCGADMRGKSDETN